MKNKYIWIFIGLITFALILILLVTKLLKGEAYELSLKAINENEQVLQVLDSPIKPSWYVLGSVSTRGTDGKANLEYTIEGSLSKAKVYTYATKKAGLWSIDQLTVAPKNEGNRINIIKDE